MAGVSVQGGKGGRRSLDSEINMIPMIDLLMVTISFLLLTAVWVQSQRLEADAHVPGPATAPCVGDCKEEPKLHVETSDPTKFVLAWKQGSTVLHTSDVPRETRHAKHERGLAFPNLAAKVEAEWKANGSHRDVSDRRFDRAVVHAANEMPYSELIGVMDAVARSKRPWTNGGKLVEAAAFDVTFAAD
ncbi:MAG TPA: biopolymer transporter ExbD [Labilithrix sp.]|nr:biopolymer transporter ExbD [Labilithrix sp.]